MSVNSGRGVKWEGDEPDFRRSAWCRYRKSGLWKLLLVGGLWKFVVWERKLVSWRKMVGVFNGAKKVLWDEW